MADSAPARNKNTVRPQQNKLLKKAVRQLLIFMISLTIVIGTFTAVVNAVYNNFIKPVDENDKSIVEVEVPMGTSVNGIADILYEKGLIRNEGVFKLMVDLSNKANKMQAGKYELSKSMTYQEMIDELLTGQVTVKTIKITIREGDDIRKIASRLVEEYDMDFTEQDFINEAKKINQFISDYPFLQDIPEERKKGEFPLEGYLFPETYYVFADDTPKRIINTMLTQFEKVFDDTMKVEADSKGFSMDDVVTLASVIQNEGKNVEFAKISAVFHNRMKKGMKLESDATVKYILNKDAKQINLTNEDISIDSKYNTYMYEGLPIGPISSPGKAAIEAALNPYEEYMKADEPMLYFVLMDPEEGLHAFNSTYEGHIADKNKYSKLWK